MAHANHIELRNIFKTYDTAAGPIPVLKDICLQVKPGESLGIVGPSGSGKSTLLNMVTGIDRPTQGEILVDGEPISRLGENALANWRRRRVGVIFQFFQLLPSLTVLENAILPMDFSRTGDRASRRRRAMELLDLVGVADQAHKLPGRLSGGQQQRVAIARALANDPPLLVADEPTGNLDSGTANEVFGLFQRLADQGKTLFVITHDRELSARLGRVVTLRDGRVQDDRRN